MLIKHIKPTIFIVIMLRLISTADAENIDPKIDEFLSAQILSQGAPGLATAVVIDGEVIHIKAYGVKEVDSEEQLSINHNFHWASNSKAFVAVAIMLLVDQGKIDLKDPVVKYLPYFRLDDDRFSEITITQLLNHSSGMPDVTDYGYENPELDDGSAERWVREMASIQLASHPGQEFHYSDMAYDVLGDVIAKVSGTTFEDYMQKNILLPLSMEASSFLYSDVQPSLKTTGHIGSPAEVSATYPYNRRHAPSGTLSSSISEMSLWLQANLNRGELNEKRILSSEKFAKLWSPSFDIPEGPQIGLGWFLIDLDGHKAVMHNGKDIGFQSHMMLFPDKKSGVIIASNWEEIDMRSIARGLHQLILDDNF